MNDHPGHPIAPDTKPFPGLLIFGMLLSTALALILAGQAWRCSPVELTCGWPLRGGWAGWMRVTPALAVLTGIIAAVLLWLGWRRARAARLVRPWAGLVLLHVTAFFLVWFLLPAGEVAPIHWLVAGVILAAIAVLVMPRARWPRIWKGRWNDWPYLFADLLMLVLPIVVWVFFRDPVDSTRVTVSLLTYPAYALMQLAAFLFLPSIMLRALGMSRRAIAMVCATMFALIHWPNPAVMAATFVAMIFWSLAHLRGRPLAMSAVVMGVLATSFTRFMPDPGIEYMKVGPGLVRLRAVETLGGRGQGEGDYLTRSAIDPDEFLRTVYPLIIGREVTAQELENWNLALTRGLRCATVHFMASVDQYRRLAEEHPVMPPPPAGVHWTETTPEWRQRIEELCSIEYWNAHGANVDDFYRAVWTEMFLQEHAAAAVPYISSRLNPPQCRRLVEVLHEQRSALRDRPFEGIADEVLRWTR